MKQLKDIPQLQNKTKSHMNIIWFLNKFGYITFIYLMFALSATLLILFFLLIT
jgi:hypothetical protein